MLIQAETDKALDRGVKMVERLLKGETEDLDDDEKAQSLTIRAIDSTLDKMCGNCLQFGHKTYDCPNPTKSVRANIRCDICGERSHPTIDCPERSIAGKFFIFKI